MRTEFSPADARRFYDRMGARQDAQGFYEDAALDLLIANGRFGSARSVVELGCGTGKLALRLLREVLPPNAEYTGIDLSPVMQRLAAGRLAAFGPRAHVLPTAGGVPLPLASGSADRFVATYVFDLLPPAALRNAVGEAFRVLEPAGLLCSVSITHGRRFPSSLLMKLWESVWRANPRLVGGCRPIELSAALEGERWEPLHRETAASRGISSEIVIARRR